MDATNLDIELVRNGLELFLPSRELGQLDMDGCPEGGAKVGGARCDVAEVVVMAELGHSLDVCSCPAQPLEDGSDVSSLLHGDDPELVFFVDPDKEGLLSIVEDPTSRRPLSVATTGLKEPITFPIKRMGNRGYEVTCHS